MSKIDPENYIQVQDCKILKACKWENSDNEIPFDITVVERHVITENGFVCSFEYKGGAYFLWSNCWIVWDGEDYLEIFTDEDFKERFKEQAFENTSPFHTPAYDTKFFEIRDYMTRICVIAHYVNTLEMSEHERAIVKSAGFPDVPAVMAVNLSNGSPVPPIGRTCGTALNYIKDDWRDLVSGQVIDVRFILGETEKPCESDFC